MDESVALADWGWKTGYDLEAIVPDFIRELRWQSWAGNVLQNLFLVSPGNQTRPPGRTGFLRFHFRSKPAREHLAAGLLCRSKGF